DAAKTDQTEIAVRSRGGSKNREVGPAASIDWEFVNGRLIDVGREVLLRGVDYRRFSADIHRASYLTNIERDFESGLTSDFDDDVFICTRSESGGVYSHRINTGLQVCNFETSGVVSGSRVFAIRTNVSDCDCGARHDFFGRVTDNAADRAGGGRLRQRYCA